MNMLNKNLIRRRMSIFLLLALCAGLCFEAVASTPDVMAVGELSELDWRCSIEAVEIDVERGEALFVLHKEGSALDGVFVSSGGRFSVDDEEIFHFEAFLDSVFNSADVKIVQLIDYNCELKGGSHGNDG